MIRILLNYALPLLLPTVIYFIWAAQRRKGKGRSDSEEHWWQGGPWFWLAVSGFLLMAATLVAFGLTDGFEPGKTYQAPRWEGGKIIPGRAE